MNQALGLSILSFILTSILIIPFINFLYRLKFRRRNEKRQDVLKRPTPVFDKLHAWKQGTPVGGGILIITLTAFLSLWSFMVFSITIKPWEVFVLIFGLISFGALGFYDDYKKITWKNEGGFSGLTLKSKFVLQWVLAFIISAVMYYKLGYNFISIHGIGPVEIGWFFIPIASFIIVSFTNAFNITDGLDGLSSGLFLICLGAFWIIAENSAIGLDQGLAIYIAILIGCIVAFLYFNIFPARIWLGDVGSLALGATLGIVGLLTGRMVSLVVIGGIFVVEIATSLLQLLSKKYRKKKLFPVAPLHLYLQYRGWEEPKIVMRFWITGVLLALLGLFLASTT